MLGEHVHYSKLNFYVKVKYWKEHQVNLNPKILSVQSQSVRYLE